MHLPIVALILLTLASSGDVSAAKRAYRAPSNANRDSLARILLVENQRLVGDSYLATAIHHPTPSVRQAAIFAAARIGDAALLPDLSGLLNSRRGAGKRDVAFALGLIPDETSVTMAVQHLAMQKDPEVLTDLYLAIGRGGGEKHLGVFEQGLRNVANPKILEGVCTGLGALWAKDSEHWQVPPGIHVLLMQRIRQNDALALPCSFALSRFKGLPTVFPPQEIVKLVEQTRNKEAVGFLLRVLAKINSPAVVGVLLGKAAPFSSPATRIEALKALGSQTPTKQILSSVKIALEAPQTSVVVEALDTLRAYGPAVAEASPALLELYKKSPSKWVKSKALRTGMVIAPVEWKPVVMAELQNAKSELRPAAAAAITLHPGTLESVAVVALLQDPNPKVVFDTLEGLSTWPESAFTDDIRTALKTILEKKDPALVSSIAPLVEHFKWQDFAPAMGRTYASLGGEWVETKVAVLAALGALGDPTLVPTLENPPIVPLSFTTTEVANATGKTVVLRTTRGEIHMKMLKDAPLNAMHFARLAQKKFYDGLAFHRVVPGFVAQGGDPRGDGFGGPGYLVRDEVSPLSHERGMVGLATSGKDTGGSQFFINLAPNLHLDGRYTIFAEVTKGMDVADRLEEGDVILSARVTP